MELKGHQVELLKKVEELRKKAAGEDSIADNYIRRAEGLILDSFLDGKDWTRKEFDEILQKA